MELAGMSKLVYEHVSEACGVTRESSSLSSGTRSDIISIEIAGVAKLVDAQV